MGLWTALKRSFVAGIVLLIPLLVTLYIFEVLVTFALTYIDPVVREAALEGYTGDIEALARAIAVGFILVAVTTLGYVAQRPAGQRLFGSLGQLVAIIPVVRTIYSTVRQVMDSFSSTESSYDSLVLVEYPRKGVYSLGLATGESPQTVNRAVGTRTRNIFLPSSPNPASGRLLLVPEEQVYEVDISVGEGFQMLMTTGVNTDEVPDLADSFDLPVEQPGRVDDEDDRRDTTAEDDTPGSTGRD